MSELKATPGPWTLVESPTHVTVIGNNRETIFHDDKRIECVMGDARLIAAAPDLLEALQKMVKMASTGMVDFNPHDEFVMSSARDAIAKATGEQS